MNKKLDYHCTITFDLHYLPRKRIQWYLQTTMHIKQWPVLGVFFFLIHLQIFWAQNAAVVPINKSIEVKMGLITENDFVVQAFNWWSLFAVDGLLAEVVVSSTLMEMQIFSENMLTSGCGNVQLLCKMSNCRLWTLANFHHFDNNVE